MDIDGYVEILLLIIMCLRWILISLSPLGTEKEPGVIPRAVQDVFSYIEEVSAEHSRSIGLSTDQGLGYQWKRVPAPSVLYGNLQWKDQGSAVCREYKPRDHWRQGITDMMHCSNMYSSCLIHTTERCLCAQLERSHCQDVRRSDELHQRRRRQPAYQRHRLQWAQQSIAHYLPTGHWEPLQGNPK